MSEQGIDYGMGVSNVDRETGIRFGVISQHSVMPEALDDFETDYGDAHCPKCGNEAKDIPSHTVSSDPPGQWVSIVQDVPEAYEEFETAKFECSEYACEPCRYLFGSDSAFSDEAIGHYLGQDGYIA